MSAPISKLASNALELNGTMHEVAREWMERGTELAKKADFQAEGRLEEGKARRIICDIADTLGAEPIVMGARRLGRVESALVGSVASAVDYRSNCPVLVVSHCEGNRCAG